MFDIGFTELLLIGIVALVVIGPERLPAVARTAGQWVAKLQRFVRGVKTDLASELESGDLKKLIGDQREQIDELKQMVDTAKREFQSSTQEVVQGAKRSLGELETSVNAFDEPDLPVNIAKSHSANGQSQAPTGDALSDSGVLDSASAELTQNAASATSQQSHNSGGASAKTEPSNAVNKSAEHQAAPSHSDSGSSSNDSAGMNRTGTESGS